MMTDIYADMANKSKENVRHEKWRVQHLGRPFDIFFKSGLFLILSFMRSGPEIQRIIVSFQNKWLK